jgi:hypothetical protein
MINSQYVDMQDKIHQKWIIGEFPVILLGEFPSTRCRNPTKMAGLSGQNLSGCTEGLVNGL